MESQYGCLYVPVICFLYAANKIIAKAKGRINPLTAPAAINIFTGCPTAKKIMVEKMINAMIICLKYFVTDVCNNFANVMDVNAEPTTDVIAALHNTSPKIL